jgi:hypothetical protein
MEYEQRVIINFLVNVKKLVNDGLGADEIEEKLKAQFAEDVYSFHMM